MISAVPINFVKVGSIEHEAGEKALKGLNSCCKQESIDHLSTNHLVFVLYKTSHFSDISPVVEMISWSSYAVELFLSVAVKSPRD